MILRLLKVFFSLFIRHQLQWECSSSDAGNPARFVQAPHILAHDYAMLFSGCWNIDDNLVGQLTIHTYVHNYTYIRTQLHIKDRTASHRFRAIAKITNQQLELVIISHFSRDAICSAVILIYLLSRCFPINKNFAVCTGRMIQLYYSTCTAKFLFLLCADETPLWQCLFCWTVQWLGSKGPHTHTWYL